ncbi:MAG: hypothetical protein K0R11_584 [Acidimicrobiales bacterium]|jgi:hypothetical protein|nr:hypothetical protein [Acidimicrobiales bacterium]
MPAAPQLSAVATALGELTTRVADLAESLSAESRDDLATALYEVERSLGAAARRLESMVDELR